MIAVLLMILGCASFFYATHVIVNANPHGKIPTWIGLPPNNPGRAFAFRMAGILLLISGAVFSDGLAWYWIAIFVLILMAPSVVYMALHNRRVTRSEPSDPANSSSEQDDALSNTSQSESGYFR